MPTITLSVPEDLKREMDDLSIINWSEVARIAIREKIGQLRALKQIASGSNLTEREALAFGRKINGSVHARHKKERPDLY